MTKTAIENKWEIKKIKEVGRVVTGKTPPTRVKEYFGKKFPFITPTDIIGNSRFIDHPARYLSDKGYEYQRNLAIPSNTVCFTCIGSVGKIAMTNRLSFTNQQINSIIVDSNIADYRYIFYLLKTEVERIKNYAGGAAKPIINKSIFEEISIPYPPLPIQQKIASILSAYDDLIELNERRIKILEEMARLIYKEWFVKFRFPGHEKVNPVRNTKQLPQDSKISNGVKMVESELGMIPEGWEVKEIFDITAVRYGENLPSKKMKKNGEYLVYGAAKVIGRYDEYNCENATVITGCRGSCGQMKITNPKSFITNNSFIFDFSEEQKLFFYYQLTTRGLQDYLGGTAQPQITLESISGLTLMVPKEKLVKHFNVIAIPIFKQIDLLDDVNTNLRQIRDMLLPKLISGEIDVSNLDIKVNGNT